MVPEGFWMMSKKLFLTICAPEKLLPAMLGIEMAGIKHREFFPHRDNDIKSKAMKSFPLKSLRHYYWDYSLFINAFGSNSEKPQPPRLVNDFAGIFTPEQIINLETMLDSSPTALPIRSRL